MCTVTVALLKRSDCACFTLHVGEDFAAIASRLGSGHCFSVHPILVLPGVSSDAPDKFSAKIAEDTLPLENGWFLPGKLSLGCIATGLVASCYGHPPPIDAATLPLCDAAPLPLRDPTQQAPPEAEHDGAPLARSSAASAEHVASSTGHEADSVECGDPVGPSLFDFVPQCDSADADKASVIRAYLTGVVGKECATQLLAQTWTTSRRLSVAGKQRIFVLHGKALKLIH